MLRFANDASTKGVIAPSRYAASVDRSACTSCGACAEICPVDAITLDAEGIAGAGDLCIGCGLCAHACLASAITLAQNKPESFIPS